ncbi:diguanylate cyclase domain-containing protein [Sporosarcina sp. SAFN-015]|uniref:diguanylate cyclase domain-containing protein n=1 Tax=Sporosarcina sp. SAFN-015 TaxID=3387274 RepID=UPI003F7D4776
MKKQKYLPIAVYAALLAMAIAANIQPILLDFGLTFIIPTIFLLLILSLYGFPIGILSAFITAGIGLYIDGSIIGAVLLMTEIAAVGLLLKYRKWGVLYSALLYWAVIGLPMYAIYVYMHNELDGWFAILALISKLINNILCALVAEILLTYIPFKRWIYGDEKNTYSFHYLISHIVLMAIALPYLIFLIGDIHYTENQIERSMSSQLQGRVKIITNELRDWDEYSILALRLQGVLQVAKVDSLIGNIDEQNMHIYVLDKDNRMLYSNSQSTLDSTIAKFSGEGHFTEIGTNSYRWVPRDPNGMDDAAIIGQTSYLSTVEFNKNSMRVLVEVPLRIMFEEEVKGFALEYANLLLFIVIGIGFTAVLKAYIVRTFGKLSDTTTGLPRKLKESAHIKWPKTRMIEFNKLTENFKEMSFELTDMFEELQESRNRLHHMAFYDSLTGVKNRSHFMEILKESVETAEKESPHALMFMDLNGFKGVNDTYGHDAGDAVLQQIAKRLTEVCGEAGSLARLGGDEFVVLLPNSSREMAAEMAKSIMKQIEKPVHFNGHLLQVGISIGISLYLHDSHTVDEMMHHGDMAMYASKAYGGSRFTFYDTIS